MYSVIAKAKSPVWHAAFDWRTFSKKFALLEAAFSALVPVFVFELVVPGVPEARAPGVDVWGELFISPLLLDFAACVAAEDPIGNSLLT